ncbi:MAG TPA: glycosyltransferase [bacterium]|nr:glycosyltransferase [bacterium]HPQ66974.1 glycosyltransferase [bacterium]
MKTAFVFSQFPCYDEAFMLREMDFLQKEIEYIILSIKKADRDPVVHAAGAALKQKTCYSRLFWSRRVLLANLAAFIASPLRYLKALILAVRLGFPDPEFMGKSLALFPQAVYFAALCRTREIAAVHGQWATYPAVTAAVIAVFNGIPFSFTGHAHDIYLKTAGLKLKMEMARFILTCTRDNVRRLLSVAPALPSDKIRVVHHGVDCRRYPFRPPSFHAGREFRILSVGSLFECKGFEYLIDACRILNEKGVDFRCRIVGGGYLEEKLKERARAAAVGGLVEFTGYQSQEKMPEHYRWGDLFVLPAVTRIHWGIPNVLIEALASGVPVACTPLPSLPELIGNPVCGFTIPEGDAGAIAGLVRRVASDPGVLGEYARRGRRKIEEEWDIVRTSAIIAGLLNDTGTTHNRGQDHG